MAIRLFRSTVVRGLAVLCPLFLAISPLSLGTPAQASTLLQNYAALRDSASHSVRYTEAIASANPTVVEFYADWCSVCQAMAPIVRDLQQTYGDRIDFVMLDIDDPQWTDQVKTFGVRGVPQYEFIPASSPTDADGQIVHATRIGRLPQPVFQQALDTLLSVSS